MDEFHTDVARAIERERRATAGRPEHFHSRELRLNRRRIGRRRKSA